jgi:hypothetical protein
MKLTALSCHISGHFYVVQSVRCRGFAKEMTVSHVGFRGYCEGRMDGSSTLGVKRIYPTYLHL